MGVPQAPSAHFCEQHCRSALHPCPSALHIPPWQTPFEHEPPQHSTPVVQGWLSPLQPPMQKPAMQACEQQSVGAAHAWPDPLHVGRPQTPALHSAAQHSPAVLHASPSALHALPLELALLELADADAAPLDAAPPAPPTPVAVLWLLAPPLPDCALVDVVLPKMRPSSPLLHPATKTVASMATAVAAHFVGIIGRAA